MLVYIRPQSTFPPLHSDTIFGSLIYSWSQLYPENLEDIIASFQENQTPPFLLSSAFPFIDTPEGTVRFYPKIIESPVKADMENMKKYKKVEFVQEEIFLKMASGEWDESTILNGLDNYVIEDNLLLEKEAGVEFGRESIIVPKNSINRLTGASENIFYAYGDNYQGMGVYFWIKILDEKIEDQIQAALKFLEDRGFGRDISTGGGHFHLEVHNQDLKSVEGDRFVTLSRYIPSPEELEFLKKDSWFDIGSKRGRSPSGEIRKQVRFFKEGSTFKHFDKDFYGQVVQSGPESLEYGIAYTLNIK